MSMNSNTASYAPTQRSKPWRYADAAGAHANRDGRQHDGRNLFRSEIAVPFQRSRSWAAVTAVVGEVRLDGAFAADWAEPFSSLLVILEEGGTRIDIRGILGGRMERSRGTSQIYYIPAGTSVTARSENLKYLRYVSLQFDPGALEGLAPDSRTLSLPAWAKLGFFDDKLLALARLFEAECIGKNPADRLLGDSLSLSLLCLLSNLDAPPAKFAKGGLSPLQLRTVTGFMEQRFAEDVAPAILAEMVNLSASHFCRAFKVSTGLPPHSWLTDLRVRKAREWLAAGERTLADIALAAGFSDQSHFTRVFARITGLSPGAWRRRSLVTE